MALATLPAFNEGYRVRFVGITLLGVPFGAEGVVRFVDGPKGSFVVEFPAGRSVCWPSELEVA